MKLRVAHILLVGMVNSVSAQHELEKFWAEDFFQNLPNAVYYWESTSDRNRWPDSSSSFVVVLKRTTSAQKQGESYLMLQSNMHIGKATYFYYVPFGEDENIGIAFLLPTSQIIDYKITSKPLCRDQDEAQSLSLRIEEYAKLLNQYNYLLRHEELYNETATLMPVFLSAGASAVLLTREHWGFKTLGVIYGLTTVGMISLVIDGHSMHQKREDRLAYLENELAKRRRIGANDKLDE